MPQLPFCPGRIFNDKLKAWIRILNLSTSQNCFETNVPLEWGGGNWSAQGGGGITVTVTPNPLPGGGFSLIPYVKFSDGDCVVETSGWSWGNFFTCSDPLVADGYVAGATRKCCGENVTFDPPVAMLLNGDVIAGAVPPDFPETCPVDSSGPVDCPSCDGPARSSDHPIRYGSGEILLQATDLITSGFATTWGHSRTYSNRLSYSENLGNGYNWVVQQWPYLVIKFLGDVTVMGIRPSVAYSFSRVGNAYISNWDLNRQTLALDSAAQVYRFTDTDGTVTEFDESTGMFHRQISPSGETITVTALSPNGFNVSQVERAYTAGGTTTTERFQYEYSSALGDLVLTRVTVQRRINAGSWSNIQRANYTYYGYGDIHGSEKDLKTVTNQNWDGSSWYDTGTTYYRYYSATAPSPSSSSGPSSSAGPSSSSSGVPDRELLHMLKFVVTPAAFERLRTAPGVTDPLTVSNSVLALYADNYFEYDSNRRVTKETVQGGSQTYLFEYDESDHPDGFNSWKYETIETRPDGSQNIVYTNYAGLTMLKVFKSGTQQWLEFAKHDENGRVILRARPSAITGYDRAYADLLGLNSGTGLYQYLRINDGLIQTFSYDRCSGLVSSERIRKGQSGGDTKLREYEYVCCGEDCGCNCSSSSSSSSGSSLSPCGTGTWFPSKGISYPSDVDQAKKIVTEYAYTFYSATCAVKERITTLPVVPVEQNGSGVAATKREYFDQYGNLTWSMDERGYITRTKYDVPTGAPTQRIDDVDTAIETDHPTGWVTPADGGLNLITDFEHDDRGRVTQTLGPSHVVDLEGTATTIRRTTWMNYLESPSANTIRQGRGYATGTSPSYTYTLVNPVSISITDLSGKLQQEIQAARASTTGRLLPSDTFAQSTYTRWKTLQYTDCCNVASERAYHNIPSGGTGTEGANYDQATFGYDAMKRRNRSVTPGGTITRLVFDPRGLVLSTWGGTNDDGATSSDPSGGGVDPDNNMVVVTSNEYDGGADGGDGNLTEQTQHASSSEARATSFVYDWRDRRVDTDGEIDVFQRVTFDNLDRIVETRRYNTTSVGNLIAKSETKYDDRGRVFKAIRYGVNPVTGVVGNSLVDNTWYDAAGSVIKSLPSGSALFTKISYDSLGRTVAQYFGYDLDETSYAAAGTVTDDTILEQSESVYDDASNVIETITRQRYHNAPANQTGPLQDPGNNPKARVTYSAMYPDSLGRAQASADYGTNGGSALSRSATAPTPLDTILVSLTAYDSAGNTLSTTDPSGMVTRMGYDDLGRVVEQIQNYQPSVSSSSSSSGGCGTSDDVNVTVRTTYNADGNVETLIAVNSATGDQVTTYVYGTTLGDSDVASSLLRRKEIYPDSIDDSDTITFEYNRQNQPTSRTDQNGTVHSYDYDLLGRLSQDRVTAVGTGVDDAVLRIATTYEVRGLQEKVTSYDNSTVGSGTVLNEVQSVYNDFNQLATEYQAHGGAVNTSTTPKVRYGYANGSDNTIRQTLLAYPNGRELTYSYGTTGGMADAASRVSAIIDDDDTHLVDYEYLGRGMFVVTNDTEPQAKWTLVDLAGADDPDTGDIYGGLDRFGRIKDNRWYNYDAEVDIDRLQYGYDRASNRLWRANLVAQSLSKEFDELYSYDGIHRLKTMGCGLLNGTETALTRQTFAQCWTLDSTANWSGMKQADTGGSWTLEQTRIANQVNEITDITNAVGSAWSEPSYDAAGSMTTMPQPTSPTDDFTATYDAWNRMVKVADGMDAVREDQYDGLRRRILRKAYTGGTLSETRHVYFTSRWQAIEERVGTSTATERQHVWGLRYIDDIVLRDRDANNDGTLDERLYSAQDSNWNVSALFDSGAVVQERYSYAAYGRPQFLTSTFDVLETSDFHWGVLFAGYIYDYDGGAYSVRNRVYHPVTGAWLQRDPLTAYQDGFNLYAYAASNPTRYADASGAVVNYQMPNPACLVCLQPFQRCMFAASGHFTSCVGGNIIVPSGAALACAAICAAIPVRWQKILCESVCAAGGLGTLVCYLGYICPAILEEEQMRCINQYNRCSNLNCPNGPLIKIL